jgi:IQ calmodulin-binding motif
MDTKPRISSGSSRVLARWQAVAAGEDPSEISRVADPRPPPPPPPTEDKTKKSSRTSNNDLKSKEKPSWVRKQSSDSLEKEVPIRRSSIEEIPTNLVKKSPFRPSSPSFLPKHQYSQQRVGPQLPGTMSSSSVASPESPRNQWDTNDIPAGAVRKANKELFLHLDTKYREPSTAQSHQLKHLKSQWTPDKEIPAGTVSGRKAALVGAAPDRALRSISGDSERTTLEYSTDPPSPLSIINPVPVLATKSVETPKESDPWVVPTTMSGQPLWSDDVPQSTSQDIWDEGEDWFAESMADEAEQQPAMDDNLLDDNLLDDNLLMSPTADTLESQDVYLTESSEDGFGFAQVPTLPMPPEPATPRLSVVNPHIGFAQVPPLPMPPEPATPRLSVVNPHMESPRFSPAMNVSRSMSSPRSAGPVDVDDLAENYDDDDDDDADEPIVEPESVKTPLPVATSQFVKAPLSVATSQSVKAPLSVATWQTTPNSQHASLASPRVSTPVRVPRESPTLVLDSPESMDSDVNLSQLNDRSPVEKSRVAQSDEKKEGKNKRRGILRFLGLKKESTKTKASKVENPKDLAKTKSVRGGRPWSAKTPSTKTLQESSSRNTGPKGSGDDKTGTLPGKKLQESKSRSTKPSEAGQSVSIEDDPASDGQENGQHNRLAPGHLMYQNNADDSSLVSEMTNPTVFNRASPKTLGDVEEKFSDESVTEENANVYGSQPVDTIGEMPAPLERRALDPFDVNSPVFASGDPFGFVATGASSEDHDPFGDPFFETASVSSHSTPKFCLPAVKAVLNPYTPESPRASNLGQVSPVTSQTRRAVDTVQVFATSPVPFDMMEQGDAFDSHSLKTSRFIAPVDALEPPSLSRKSGQDPVEVLAVAQSHVGSSNLTSENPVNEAYHVAPLSQNKVHQPSVVIEESADDEFASDPEIAMLSSDEDDEDNGGDPAESKTTPTHITSSLLPAGQVVISGKSSNIPSDHDDLSGLETDAGNNAIAAQEFLIDPSASNDEACSLLSLNQSVDSTGAVYPSQSIAFNNRLRKKRLEKKMRKAGIVEIQEEIGSKVAATASKPPTQDQTRTVSGKADQHISKSAYLGRFENKSKPKVLQVEPSLPPPSVPPRVARKASVSKLPLDSEDEMSWSTEKATAPNQTSASSVSGSSPRMRGANKRRKPVINDVPPAIMKEASPELNVPRSILRKPSRAVPEADKPALGFDENKISDPMHRAGLRLLAAAVIPIQAAIRRFLAKREALNRMWSVVTIQTYTRRWMAAKNFENSKYAAIQIQKAFRGWFARDYVEDQHYCATQIQRIARGYLATLAVYEDIYKVTLIQSYVRMQIAVDEATYKMAFIIQLQSVVRGYLVRRQRDRLDGHATAIQKTWRCRAARMNYQFDILDIVLIQSLLRQKRARSVVEKKRNEHHEKCATKLQAQWRSYDCTMNYLHYLADVLIVQSAIRRRMAVKRVNKFRDELHFGAVAKIQRRARDFLVRNRVERNNAALSIQTAWRGFVCYADYMFTIADIVIVQTCMRSWLAKRELIDIRHARDSQFVKPFQSLWRGYCARKKYDRQKHHIVICQSVLRRFVAWSKYMKALTEKYAAETIQRAWWEYLLRRDEHYAATTVQRVWRGYACKKPYSLEVAEFRAARTIQSSWRKFWLFSSFIIMLDSAIRIQAFERGVAARTLMQKKHDSATMIQSHTRCFLARRTASTMSMIDALLSSSRAIAGNEVNAAITLQSTTRGAQARYAVLLFLKALKIQAVWRGSRERHVLSHFRKARKIQAVWRGSEPRRAYIRYRAAVRIQSCWRRARAHEEYVKYTSFSSAGARIKRWLVVQRDNSRWAICIAAVLIQSWYRSRRDFGKYEKYRHVKNAAVVIQKSWRGFLCYTDYIFTVADIVIVQRICRGYIGRQRAYDALLTIKGHESACLIQRIYRGFQARTGQDVAQALLTYRSKRFHYASTIQRHWRGFDQKRRYWYLLGSCLQVQRALRGSFARKHYAKERASIVTVQCVFRQYMAKQKYMQMRFIMMLLVSAENEKRNRAAANTLRVWYLTMRRNRVENKASCVIQGFFLMVKAMVEKEIRAEKRRRKLKKLMRNRTPAFEEKLLEDAWADSVLPSKNEPTSDSIRRAEMAAANSLKGVHLMSHSARSASAPRPRTPNSDSSATEVSRSHRRAESSGTDARSGGDVSHYHRRTGSSGTDARSRGEVSRGHRRTGSSGTDARSRDDVSGSLHRTGSSGTDARSRDSSQYGMPQSSSLSRAERRRHDIEAASRAGSHYSQKMHLPPQYSPQVCEDHVSVSSSFKQEAPPTDSIRLSSSSHDDDSASEVSALSAMSHFRQPPARSKTFTKKDLDDDFSLEEAWIDTEIYSVKERMTQSSDQRRSNSQQKRAHSGQQRQPPGQSPHRTSSMQTAGPMPSRRTTYK